MEGVICAIKRGGGRATHPPSPLPPSLRLCVCDIVLAVVYQGPIYPSNREDQPSQTRKIPAITATHSPPPPRYHPLSPLIRERRFQVDLLFSAKSRAFSTYKRLPIIFPSLHSLSPYRRFLFARDVKRSSSPHPYMSALLAPPGWVHIGAIFIRKKKSFHNYFFGVREKKKFGFVLKQLHLYID